MKYHCEEWFKNKLHAECISLKDALKLSITNALEKDLVIYIRFHGMLEYSTLM